ncbi:hypothetical protein AB0C10_15980 [Microbispora amethystogenes]|uniref:hypothetical protein n=1 Tax=Microbispora amethystogenes TaxID=1427754 RepID=UPI0033E65B07
MSYEDFTRAASLRLGITREITLERMRQHNKFGLQQHPDGTGGETFANMAKVLKDVVAEAAANGTLTWQLILMEEIYEALAETDPAKLGTELVQVAAVCVAWVEDLRTRPVQEAGAGDR